MSQHHANSARVGLELELARLPLGHMSGRGSVRLWDGEGHTKTSWRHLDPPGEAVSSTLGAALEH